MPDDPSPLMNAPTEPTPTHWDHPFQLHLISGHTLRLMHADAMEEGTARAYVTMLLRNANSREPNEFYADSFESEATGGVRVDVDMRQVVAVTYDPPIPVYARAPREDALPFRIRMRMVDGTTITGAIDGAETPEDVLRMMPELSGGGGVVIRTVDGPTVMVRMAHIVLMQFEGQVP